MRMQPEKGTKTNDVVYTPRPLAKRIIEHFKPNGRVLDPARGDGAFYDQIEGEKDWCEINMGRDFFSYKAKADCIITNPPWSLFRQYLIHSMELANDIYFLITINHVWTKARLREVREKGFGIKEIFLIDSPSNFPQSGFQVGVVHFKRGWKGDIRITEDEVCVQETFDFYGNKR
jgi:hypothetical protein